MRKKKKPDGKQSTTYKNSTTQLPTIAKIRIGYIHEDFAEGYWRDFLTAFLDTNDSLRYEVFIYNLTNVSEAKRKILANKAMVRYNLAELTSEECIKLIRHDRLDIIVDLSPKVITDKTLAIFRSRLASKQLTMATDIPQYMLTNTIIDARIVGQGETVNTDDTCKSFELDGLKWLYRPFKLSSKYCYRAPRLDRGITTIGIVGSVPTAKCKQELLTVITRLLNNKQQLQIVVAPSIVGVLNDEDIAVLEQLGTQDTIIVLSDDLPYEALDLALAINVDCLLVVELAMKSIPLLTAESWVVDITVSSFLRELGIADLVGAKLEELPNLIAEFINGEQVEEYHQELYNTLCNSDIVYVGKYIFLWELMLERVLYADLDVEKADILSKFLQAKSNVQWEQVLAYGKQLYAHGKLPNEEIITIACGYYFLNDDLRTALWAEVAMAKDAPLPLTQVYLQIDNAINSNKMVKLLQLVNQGYELIESGLESLPDIDRKLVQGAAGALYSLGNDMCLQAGYAHYELANTFFEKVQYFSNWLFMHNSELVSPQEVYEKSLAYNDLFKDIKLFSHEGREAKPKIRLGYISPDFRHHVMQYFLWPMLATYDREKFEVYAYNLGDNDQYSDVFKTLVDKWHSLGDRFQDYEYIAKIVYDDEIDILFDLAGHTAKTGLPVLAWKPAPVQLSGLGYMATTALKTVDYFITDDYVDPDEQNEPYFTEKLLRLKSQFCYNGYTNLPVSTGTPARTTGYIQFATFNKYKKIKDEVLLAWLEIMRRVPNSRLLLKNSAYNDRLLVSLVRERLRNLGFDLNRVCFDMASHDYMLDYLQVDIALDTYPWPGGGTTADALYMGVPVISLYSSRHSSRFTYSMLANIGLQELATDDINEYIDKAVKLANDLDTLDDLHRSLRARMKSSPLMDQVGYIRDLEEKYLAIWEQYQNQNAH